MKKTYDITGMSCAACAAHVEGAVKKLDGADNVNVNLIANSMTVDVNTDKLSDEDIEKAVKNAGYGACPASGQVMTPRGPVRRDAAVSASQPAAFPMGGRLAVSLSFWAVLMYVSMGQMIHLPLPPLLTGDAHIMVKALTELLLLIPVGFVNRSYFTGGFRMLFRLYPNMDSLIALGSSASAAYSLVTVFRMAVLLGRGDVASAAALSGELYFESSATILTLITLGKFFEARSKKKTADAITDLMKLVPGTASVERGGAVVTIPIEELRAGDTVIVRAGESFPADGSVISGACSADESSMTGESIPVEKNPGDTVTAGTVCVSGFVRFTASKVGDDTALSNIIRLVRDAGGSKAPIAKLADRISAVFVPAVLAVSLITFLVWKLSGSTVGAALTFAVSVLVISCPCALGLATPTAIMAGTGRGAAEGILFKSAESIQRLRSVDTVVLDKTGTVTNGRAEVTDVIAAEGSDKDELLIAAAAAEAGSGHPLAAAITQYTAAQGIKAQEAGSFEAVPGRGVRVALAGKTICAGSAKMAVEAGADVSAFEETAGRLADEGKTVLYFTSDDRLLGLIAAADTVRQDSAAAVARLQSEGMRVILLTGDNDRTASAVASRVGIDEVISGVLPDEKAGKIRELHDGGRTVAMIGDGINDAPALTAADVGMAIGAGTNVAIDSADVVLMRSSLSDAASSVALSRAVMRNIKENLFWAFIYNIICIPLAAGVLYPSAGIRLDPMIGAAAMSFSSVFVVSNALRLRYFGRHGKSAGAADNKEDKTMKKTVKIDGMMCDHCRMHVADALNGIEGVQASVSLADKQAVLTLSRDVSDEEITKAVTAAGYKVVAIS